MGNSNIPRPMNRKERQEARAERYRQFAENAEKKATDAFNAGSAAVENIPLGQPILVGHHSEKAHRRALDRSNSAMMRCVHESEKAAYYRQKAEAVENNDNIYLGDDDAIERLSVKIAKLTDLQEQMKGANKIVRASKLSDFDKIDALVNLGITRPQAEKMVANKILFPGYALTNNNAKINAAKKQLAKAEALASKEDREYSIDDITIEECYWTRRVRTHGTRNGTDGGMPCHSCMPRGRGTEPRVCLMKMNYAFCSKLKILNPSHYETLHINPHQRTTTPRGQISGRVYQGQAGAAWPRVHHAL